MRTLTHPTPAPCPTHTAGPRDYTCRVCKTHVPAPARPVSPLTPERKALLDSLFA